MLYTHVLYGYALFIAVEYVANYFATTKMNLELLSSQVAQVRAPW